MSWTAPAVDAVLSEFTPAERAAIEAIQQDTEQANLPAILARVVAEVRDYIRSGGYALSTDETLLPLGLHNDCISLARWRYVSASPALARFRTEPREKASNSAMEKLNLIAAQKFAVEPPTASGARAGSWGSENKVVPRMHPVPPPGTQYQGNTGYANPDAPADHKS